MDLTVITLIPENNSMDFIPRSHVIFYMDGKLYKSSPTSFSRDMLDDMAAMGMITKEKSTEYLQTFTNDLVSNGSIKYEQIDIDTIMSMNLDNNVRSVIRDMKLNDLL